MKSVAIKALSVLVMLAMIFSLVSATAVASQDTTEKTAESETQTYEEKSHALVLQSESLTVAKYRTIQMTATVTNMDVQPVITWKSSDTSIATVDETGKVKGVSVGLATIYASAKVNGETLVGEFQINVTTNQRLLKNLLEKHQVLSYQYSYIDDYYYTNDKEAWQYNFGFGKIYDLASPYLLLEYDYIRVFFTYEGKDWMIQMWKGQYGMIFYGGEIGVYNRDHVDDGINEWTFFNCPAEEDWLKMEMTLYHQDIQGNWKREFTRPYDTYWWCTGFKNGHLRQEEPANELRLNGRVTMKDEEMTKLWTDGLVECGFTKAKSLDTMKIDQIYVDGTDVYFSWQNISEAESTMFIKVSVGLISSLAVLPFWPFILPYVGIFAVIVLIASLLV